MLAKKALLIIMFLVMLSGTAQAEWDFYFFGVNMKMIEQADYKSVALGAVTSLAVHTAGHYAYAGLTGMHVKQDGFNEYSASGYSAKRYREFAQAGFVFQHAVGLLLTSIPATRNTDFTRGYVGFALAETLTYPVVHRNEGDLCFSGENGGDRDMEYAAFMALATHNVLRVKFYK